jgi:transposase
MTTPRISFVLTWQLFAASRCLYLTAGKSGRSWLRSHLEGVLAWTRTRLSNGAVEGMNNKIKSISHRSYGFRSAANFIAAIYHCCARLPLPAEA